MASKRHVKRKLVRQYRNHSCRGKLRHEDHDSAREHAINLQRQFGKSFNLYRCSFCQGYHVGHQPDSEALARIRKQKQALNQYFRKVA